MKKKKFYKRCAAMGCAFVMLLSTLLTSGVAATDADLDVAESTTEVEQETTTNITQEPTTALVYKNLEQNTKPEINEVTSTKIYGDVNNDGKVDIADVLQVQSHISNLITLNKTQIKYADVVTDGNVDLADVMAIQKYIAEILSALPYDASAETAIAKKITVTPISAKVPVGEVTALKTVVTPATAVFNLTYTSSNPSVATVDAAGLITAKAIGTTVITVKTDNGLSAKCNVTVLKHPDSVSLDKTEFSLLIGEMYTLKPSVPQGSAEGTYTYTTSNQRVATVDSTGKVTARSVGSAVIVVKTYNGKVAVSTVTVLQEPSSVSLNKTNLSLTKGDTSTLVASVPANSVIKAYTFSSSNQSVATVDVNGKVTAKAVGSAVITVKTYNNKTAACKVTVTQPPASVSLNKTSLSLTKGDTSTLTASVPANSTIGAYTYSSSNASVATVDANGKVTAKAGGSAVITVKTYNGKTATCKVTVTQPPESVSLNKTAVSLNIAATYTLVPSVPANSVIGTYTYSSSNTSIATVDSKGKVTAKAGGTAVITVKTYNGKTAKCTVTVNSSITSITIKSTSASIQAGNHAYLTATTKPSGKSVEWSSSNTAIAKVSKGIVTGIKAGTATITAKDPNGSVKATYKITVTSSSSMSITYSSKSIEAGKSVYLKSTSGAKWSSSNTSVATVDSKGFVTTKAAGVAIITATSGSQKKTCALSVTAAAAVRYSYTSPNSAVKNDTITFIAITDKTRTAVQWRMNVNGKDYTVNATSKSNDSTGKNYVWKGTLKFTVAGEFAVKTYSKKGDVWSTHADGNCSVFVTNTSSKTAVSFDKRRPSNELLSLNSNYEGYIQNVMDDPLVVNTPTVGYGHVVYAGETFYNGLSKEEAFAWMVSSMNDSVYSSAVNNFMSNNNIKFNQRQFDSLVMLVYNLGSGVLSNSDVKSILLNCVESSGTTSSTTAYVNASGGLNIRSGAGTGYSSLGILANGTKVTILEKTNSSWYKVKSSTGITGYCSTSYLTIGSSRVRNMNNVSRSALCGELLQWHHAGGSCSWGLLYRRIDEMEVFFYGDYTRDGSSNKYNMNYYWCNR